jgi:hypothetical protein
VGEHRVTVYLNDWEGQTAGTAATTANTANSGQQTTVQVSSGASATYTTDAFRGSRALALVSPNTTGVNVVLTLTMPATVPAIAFRGYFKYSAVPGNALQLVSFRSTADQISRLVMTTARTIQFQNDADSTVATSAALSLNTWYRLEMVVQPGTTTSNGYGRYAVYLGDSPTPVSQFTSSAFNAGTSPLANVQYGKLSGLWNATQTWDAVAIADQATFIGRQLPQDTPINGSTVTDDFTSASNTFWTGGSKAITNGRVSGTFERYTGYDPYGDYTGTVSDATIPPVLIGTAGLTVRTYAGSWTISASTSPADGPAFQVTVFTTGSNVQARIGSNTNTAVAYNTASMAYWRLRTEGATAFIDYSADRTSWTQFHTGTYSVGDYGPSIFHQVILTGAAPGTLDDLNLTSAVAIKPIRIRLAGVFVEKALSMRLAGAWVAKPITKT